MAQQFPDVWTASAGSQRNAAWDMSDDLDEGETLSGSPDVDEIGSSDLTITSKVVNVAALEDVKQRQVAIGHAVQARITGFVSGRTYTVRVSVATSANQRLVYDQLIVAS